MSMTQRILGVLAAGPATTGEIQTAVDPTNTHKVGAFLCALRRTGRVTSRPFTRSAEGVGRRSTTLWEARA